MTFWGLLQTKKTCVIKTGQKADTWRHTTSSPAYFTASLNPANPSQCLLSSLPALVLFVPSLPLFLWVTPAIAWSSGGGGYAKERPMGVSTTPDCGFCTLSLLTTRQVRDFSSYFVYHQGNYYITSLFDWLEAHFHSPDISPACYFELLPGSCLMA